MVATVITGLKEPLRCQVQLRVTSATRCADIRERVLQYENVNAPWSSSVSGKGAGGGSSSGPQPMEVDQVTAWKGGKGKDKGKGKYIKGTSKDKGKGGKKGGGKQDGRPWQHQQQHSQSGKGKDSSGRSPGMGTTKIPIALARQRGRALVHPTFATTVAKPATGRTSARRASRRASIKWRRHNLKLLYLPRALSPPQVQLHIGLRVQSIVSKQLSKWR